MSSEQQAWFDVSSCANNGLPCCSQWPETSSVAPTSRDVCGCWSLTWGDTIPQQFDNIFEALLTLFEVSTTEGWVDVMYACVDAVGIGMQPIRDHARYWMWFYMTFILVGSYLALNLFVCVIIDNFNHLKSRREGGGVMVTEKQEAWIKTHQITMRMKPTKKAIPPPDFIGKVCFRVIYHRAFDWFINTNIFANTLLMSFEYFGQSDELTLVLQRLNVAFVCVFAAEAAVKIGCLRGAYFKGKWDRFDFSVVVLTIAGLVLTAIGLGNYGSLSLLVRVIRTSRILRLARGLPGMKEILETTLLMLPSLANIGALLFMILFMYSVLGTQLFATIAMQGSINAHANFQQFWRSMLLLIRFSTGESWNKFMHDATSKQPGCVDQVYYSPHMCGFSHEPGCIPLNGCGTWIIIPYCLSFTVIVTFVMLNLFIGVILGGFDLASAKGNDLIKQADFDTFCAAWTKYDPEATSFITADNLYELLGLLKPPWGYSESEKVSEKKLIQKIRSLKLKLFSGDRVHFHDLLVALSASVHQEEAAKQGHIIQLPETYQLKMAQEWQKLASLKKRDVTVNPISNEELQLDHLFAAKYIQIAYRKALQRRAQREAAEELAREAEAMALARDVAAAVESAGGDRMSSRMMRGSVGRKKKSTSGASDTTEDKHGGGFIERASASIKKRLSHSPHNASPNANPSPDSVHIHASVDKRSSVGSPHARKKVESISSSLHAHANIHTNTSEDALNIRVNRVLSAEDENARKQAMRESIKNSTNERRYSSLVLNRGVMLVDIPKEDACNDVNFTSKEGQLREDSSLIVNSCPVLEHEKDINSVEHSGNFLDNKNSGLVSSSEYNTVHKSISVCSDNFDISNNQSIEIRQAELASEEPVHARTAAQNLSGNVSEKNVPQNGTQVDVVKDTMAVSLDSQVSSETIPTIQVNSSTNEILPPLSLSTTHSVKDLSYDSLLGMNRSKDNPTAAKLSNDDWTNEILPALLLSTTHSVKDLSYDSLLGMSRSKDSPTAVNISKDSPMNEILPPISLSNSHSVKDLSYDSLLSISRSNSTDRKLLLSGTHSAAKLLKDSPTAANLLNDSPTNYSQSNSIEGPILVSPSRELQNVHSENDTDIPLRNGIHTNESFAAEL